MDNPEVVWKKIQKMHEDGADKLMFISDFDCTLSKYKDSEGNRCNTTHAVIEGAMSVRHPELADKAAEMDKKYVQFEYCPIMTVEEKIPYMVEWWENSHNFAVQAKLTRQEVAEYVAKSRVYLRDLAKIYLKKIEENGLPHIVFSAGVGDIIENVFKNQVGYIPKGLHIISNMMVYDENNTCNGFTEPLIHTFNKNSTVLNNDMLFYEEIKGRKNVFLLGDSLGDSQMDLGVKDEGVALKIGFLNFNFDTLLDKYMEHYDIVILDDQTMAIPLEILDYILEKSSFENSVEDFKLSAIGKVEHGQNLIEAKASH
uniref:5'-nucleotidase n=1 Tax=Acrobeloides nanus TaxID=290746 RepID=A0A914D4S6_9BILA